MGQLRRRKNHAAVRVCAGARDVSRSLCQRWVTSLDGRGLESIYSEVLGSYGTEASSPRGLALPHAGVLLVENGRPVRAGGRDG